MKTFREFIWIISILLFGTCTNEKKESQELQVIDIEDSMDNMEVINLSSFATSVRYVALETKIDNYLSYVKDYVFQREKTIASGFENFAHIYPFNKRVL